MPEEILVLLQSRREFVRAVITHAPNLFLPSVTWLYSRPSEITQAGLLVLAELILVDLKSSLLIYFYPEEGKCSN